MTYYWEDPNAEEIALGIAVHNISKYLPKHPTKKYKTRDKKAAVLFFHHSGADSGLEGFGSFMAMADYHVRVKTLTKGEWPGIAYHWGFSIRPVIDNKGRLVIFQLNPANALCYHTKGCNKFGEGAVLQGHHGNIPLSPCQIESLEAFIPWRCRILKLDYHVDIGWHSISMKWGGIPKLACPGKYAVKYLKDYINDRPYEEVA